MKARELTKQEKIHKLLVVSQHDHAALAGDSGGANDALPMAPPKIDEEGPEMTAYMRGVSDCTAAHNRHMAEERGDITGEAAHLVSRRVSVEDSAATDSAATTKTD